MSPTVDRPQPLAGVRVIDLTRILSGPFCTMLLADMGADVIKVEGPGEGDHVRQSGTLVEGFSPYFASFNRNKRSITLDLKSEAGKAVLTRLVAEADVLVENYRPGVLAKMGFTPQRLAEINPRLVVGSVNGFGSTGPYVDRPAFDFITQAMSGFMSVNGRPGDEPMRCAPPLTDLIAGLYCAFGIVCALRGAERDGAGQAVEAAMLNGILSMMAYLASEYFTTGKLPERTGNDHPIASPYGLFRCADGDIAVAPSTRPVLARFLGELGLAHLLDDPRYDTPHKRFARRRELHDMIDEKLAADVQANWIARFNKAGVPCGRVMTLDEVFADPQVGAQEMAIDVDHPGFGPVRMLGFPVKLSQTPCRVNRPAPALGADTDAVLTEAGYDADEIARLRRAGIV